MFKMILCWSDESLEMACKARYTLAAKLNSTRSTLLKVDCCRNRQLPYTFNFVADTVDFVASVYGAKTTRSGFDDSTFNKVDRVEFNFVASVYRA